MKQSALVRKTPLRSTKPMSRGTTRMRAKKPVSAKPKRAAREAEDRDQMNLCHGKDCYLLIPGICTNDSRTVVPAHSNQSIHGKGGSIKAHNRYTVPGCSLCHFQIDQGTLFTKAEKFAFWDAAFARWEVDRAKLLPKESD